VSVTAEKKGDEMQRQHQANIYPVHTENPNLRFADARRENIGVAFSGGGSRSLSCTWGQLLALNHSGIIDRVRYISSVSGGSWASVAYTYLPETISDADFLGKYHPPETLSVNGGAGKFNLSSLGSHNLGVAPGNLTFEKMGSYALEFIVASAISLHFEKRLNPRNLAQSFQWLWMYIVGNGVLSPFGLYNYKLIENISLPITVHPPWNAKNARFFSLSASYLKEQIPDGSKFHEDDFFFVRSGSDSAVERPLLIVNTTLLKPTKELNSSDVMEIPVQISPVTGSVFGRDPLDPTFSGGGGVDPFGFSATLVNGTDGNGTVEVSLPRRLNLADIASLSSAFYADTLANIVYENLKTLSGSTREVVEMMLPVSDELLEKLEEGALDEILRNIKEVASREALLNNLVPKYNYWSVRDAEERKIENTLTEFSDGGSLENTGVLGMLTQTEVDRIVSFVNTDESIRPGDPADPDSVVALGQASILFGVAYDEAKNQFAPYRENGINPFTGQVDSQGFLTVFQDGITRFLELRREMLASTRHPEHGYGYYPAFYVGEYELIDNPNVGVSAKKSDGSVRKVKIMWVQNNRINCWQEKLTDPALSELLSEGQHGQNRDGTPNGKVGHGDLQNFPFYNTFTQIGLGPVSVNALSQMWAWALCDEESPLAVELKRFLA